MSIFKISFFVLSMHAALIVWGAYHVPSPPAVKQTRLVTQTIAFNETKRISPSDTPAALAEKKNPDSPAAPTEKKNPDPPVVKKKEKPKPKPAPKPVESEKKAEEPKKNIIKDASLIAKAKENIAKITKTSDKTNTSEPQSSAPQPKHANNKESELLSSHEMDYRDELAGRLKLILRLPEYGMVNVRLTVDRRGRVKKIEIIAAESETNKKYIESELPQLVFPAFGSNFGGEPDHTFLISLNNEM